MADDELKDNPVYTTTMDVLNELLPLISVRLKEAEEKDSESLEIALMGITTALTTLSHKFMSRYPLDEKVTISLTGHALMESIDKGIEEEITEDKPDKIMH